MKQKTYFWKLFFGVSVLFAWTSVRTQTFTYSNTMTPVQLVNQVLLTEGMIATDIQFKNGTGANNVFTNTVAPNLRSFTATTPFPFSEGLYIRTESGLTLNDADLQSLVAGGQNITNGGILEFDFIAIGDSLSFNYMFVSSEYTNYTCSSFNDVFGFFLSGPGINGPYSNNAINIATIPGSNNIPVGINTVNCGCKLGELGQPCATANPNYISDAQYWTNQYGTYGNEGGDIKYNGGTVSLPAGAKLQCGETYHIKMGVVNVQDAGHHSGVFIQGGSFGTGSMKVDFDIITSGTVEGADSVLYEGCNNAATIFFNRENNEGGCFGENDTIQAWLTWGGTATNGVDYTGAQDTITLPPGTDTVSIVLKAVEDNLVEGIETIIITVKRLTKPGGDTITQVYTLYIDDRPLMQLHAHDTVFYCLEHEPKVTWDAVGGFPGFTYEWKVVGEDTTIIYTDSIDSNTMFIYPKLTANGTYKYMLIVTDTCEYTMIDTAVVVMKQTLHIDSMEVFRAATCDPIGWAGAWTFPYGAHMNDSSAAPIAWTYNLHYKWIAKHDTTLVFPDENSLDSVSAGWYYLELTDSNIHCMVRDSVYIPAEDVPQAIIAPSATSGCAPLNVTFGNQSLNSNSYEWDFGDGNLLTTSDKNSYVRTYADTTVVYEIRLVASNGDVNCNDTMMIQIKPEWCPIPTAYAPNVLNLYPGSPNNVYYIHTENAASINMLILNRWGNVIYQNTGTQDVPPKWNGIDDSGNQVPDGVYFVKYTVIGIMGDELKGNEFVTVVR